MLVKVELFLICLRKEECEIKRTQMNGYTAASGGWTTNNSSIHTDKKQENERRGDQGNVDDSVSMVHFKSFQTRLQMRHFTLHALYSTQLHSFDFPLQRIRMFVRT